MSTMDFSKYLPTPYFQKEYEYNGVSNSNYMWNELWSTYYELIDTISNNIKKQLDDINEQLIETPDDAKLISIKIELNQEFCALNREHKGIIIEPYWGLQAAIFFIKNLRFASSEEWIEFNKTL